MRLFVALDIDDDIRGRITRFVDGTHGFAPEARWVRRESLHVTLKFIGEKSEQEMEKIALALQTVTADAIEITFRGYGFFPNARAPRLFWIGVEAGPKLTSLAATIDEKLISLNIPKEVHAFNAHLTLARDASRPSVRKENARRSGFLRLQEKLSALPTPEFGTMTAREFSLFQSHTLPGGSLYKKLAAFALH
jgi:RNA 2',3'-cyclic 3'-phosphodiesterase